MRKTVTVPKNLIGAKIIDITNDELHGNFILTARSDFGEVFELFFAERCGDVELEIDRNDFNKGEILTNGGNSKMERQVNIGDSVIFHDPKGRAHNALVTTVWSPEMVNVVFVSGDDSRQDSYGRQTERATSLPHKSQSTVHGYYWRFADEEPNEYVPPQAV